MKLSDRKKKILSAVVDESISRGEPISSKDIQEKYLSEYSPATIRNELMALEEMGFLSQPHTSAGRVPTVEGYKKYVDELMTIKRLSKKEADLLKDGFNERLLNLNDVLKKAAKTISSATNYASVVYYGITPSAVIENIVLVKLTEKQTLVVVVTDQGSIKEETNSISASEDELLSANKILLNVLRGRKIGEMNECRNLVTGELLRYKTIFDCIIELLTERDDLARNMAVEGKDNLLSYPEFQDQNKLKNTMHLLERQDDLYKVMSDPNVEVSVRIGGDDEDDLKDVSIVTATYKVNGKPIGSAGVVGPVRMDYSKVVSILKNVTKLLEENDFFGGNT